MATYFIDVKNGKNENSGLNENEPIMNYEALDLKPGDTVLFKRGSFIRSKLKVKQGEKNNPITYAAYGEGDLPTFCGSVNLTDEGLWKEEEKNIWVIDGENLSEAANFVYNRGESCGTLRWTKGELSSQGDFFDNCFGVSETKKELPNDHKIYLWSQKNPALYYSDIECVAFGERRLADNGHDINFINLRFINSGVHAIAGEGKSANITIDGCRFEFIGGAVWNKEMKIRFGNGVEFWDYCDNIEIKNCLFNDIYDSAVTHQGGGNCRQANNFIIHDNVFIKCGMAAFEQRDKMPLYCEFTNNICADAGEGFSKLGEIMPRYSEIWPEPMGHHVFLWRIEKGDGGQMEIKDNVFSNAPYGAAIYSIISENAEKCVNISSNTYYTENTELLNRFNGKNYKSFEEYEAFEKDCSYKKDDIEKLIKEKKSL